MPDTSINIVVPQRQADVDADIAVAAPGVVLGFPASVQGWDNAAEPYFSRWAPGTRVYVKATGREVLILPGGVSGKVAIIIATGSATPAGGSVGSPLLYVVAPAALALPNTFPLLSLAVAAAPVGTPAAFLALPGTYNEAGATVNLWDGCTVFGFTEANGAASTVIQDVNFQQPVSAGKVMLQNITFDQRTTGVHVYDSVGANESADFSSCRLRYSGLGATAVTGGAPTFHLYANDCDIEAKLTLNASTARATLKGTKLADDSLFAGGLDASGCEFARPVEMQNSSSLQECVSTYSGGTPFVYNAFVPGTTLRVRSVTLTNPPPLPANYVISNPSAVGGTVYVDGLTVQGTSNANWIESTLTVFSNAGTGNFQYTTAAGVSFALDAFVDIANITPSAPGVAMTLPRAARGVTGHRIKIKNESNAEFLQVIPTAPELIDTQTAAVPVWIAPQDSIDLECDRANTKWNILSQRGAKSVYAVAKPHQFVSGSFPSIADAMVQIAHDRATNPSLQTPVMDLYPGTWNENISINRGISIRGSSADPSAAVIVGTLSIAATLGSESFSLENFSVTEATTISDSAVNATIDVKSCIFGTTVLAVALSIAAANNASVVRVTGCKINAFNTNALPGVQLTGNVPGGRFYFGQNSVLGENRRSITVANPGPNTVIEENYFEGSANYIQNSINVLVYVRRNRSGVENSTGPGYSIQAGNYIYLEDELCVPLDPADRGLYTTGLGRPIVGRLRLLAPGVPVEPTGQTLPLRQYPSRQREDAAGLNLQTGPTVYRITAPGAYVLPSYSNFPTCCDFYIFNDQVGAITVAARPGEAFGPAGAANPQVVPGGGRLHLLCDPQNTAWWIVSTV